MLTMIVGRADEVLDDCNEKCVVSNLPPLSPTLQSVANAFTLVSVIYLDEQIGLPSGKIFQRVKKWYDPLLVKKTCMQDSNSYSPLCIVCFYNRSCLGSLSQVLGWLPPLIFTALVEADVSQTYAVVAITTFFLFAIALLRSAAPCNGILKESGWLDEDDKKPHVAEGEPHVDRNEADEEYDQTE
jgi:hypothetical protein